MLRPRARDLSFARKRLAPGTLELREPFLQSFVEAYGRQLVSKSKPFHMEAWLDDHSEWENDWTKYSALRNVRVAFNWAWKKRAIDQNPFRGVSHRPGLPRRDMKPVEFQALLRATRGKVYKNGLRPALASKDDMKRCAQMPASASEPATVIIYLSMKGGTSKRSTMNMLTCSARDLAPPRTPVFNRQGPAHAGRNAAL